MPRHPRKPTDLLTCSTCGVVAYATAFYPRQRTCKPCYRAQAARTRTGQQGRRIPPYRCTGCAKPVVLPHARCFACATGRPRLLVPTEMPHPWRTDVPAVFSHRDGFRYVG